MSTTIEKASWVDAGLAQLAKGGVGSVRVEVLAEELGVTKGGFYRRFKDRRALLDAILAAWASGRIEAIKKHTERGEESAGNRLELLLRRYADRVNAQGMAIELAIRQWARSDPAAAAVVAKVDVARVRSVENLYRHMGYTAEDAQARAVIYYSYIFGQSLLFLDNPSRRRAALNTVCASILTRRP